MPAGRLQRRSACAGDTDYALTAQFDRFDADGVRFVFGFDARANLIERAESADEAMYHELVTRAERQIATKARTRPAKVKDDIVRERGYKVLRQKAEDVVEFSYRPTKCKRDYRVVALRKNISVERGENVLFDEYRYFFYITNERTMTADWVVGQARQRCNQENLISQLKSDVRALHAPVNTLNANWAYMIMATLAWSLKAWCALLLPVSPRWAEQPRRAAAAPAHHGVPHLLAGLHRDPLPDRHHRPACRVARPRLQRVAGGVLPPPRRPLTGRQPLSFDRPDGRRVSDPANRRESTRERKTTPIRTRITIPTPSHRRRYLVQGSRPPKSAIYIRDRLF